jgi:PAS domain S-box-containing protein
MRISKKRVGRAAFLAIHSVRRFLLWMIVVGTWLGSKTVSGYEAQKNVLLLYADRNDFRGNIIVNRTIRSVLNEKFESGIDLHSEYLDLPIPSPEDERAFRDFFHAKYDRRKIDVVVGVGTSALRFLRDYGTELFPGVPVVSWGGKSIIENWGSGPPVTGVVGLGEAATVKAGFEFIRKLQPDIGQIVLVSGASSLDRTWEAAARENLGALEAGIGVTHLAALPLEDMLKRLAPLPSRTAIFFLGMNEDGAGRRLSSFDAIRRIAQVAAAPVYGFSADWLDAGIVGGVLIDLEAMARAAADMVLRLFDGQHIQDIPKRVSPLVPMVHWRQLSRWNISEGRLPPGTVVLHRDPPLLEAYKFQVIGVISLCVIQTLLIAGLLVQRARRKRAETAMRASEQRYRNVVETQTEMICRFLPDTTLTFVNDAYCRYFGKKRGELVGRKFVELIPESSRSGAVQHVTSVAATASAGSQERQVMRPDGTLGWQHWTDYVVLDSTGRVVELQGIGRDVTQQKLAEESAASTRELLQSTIDALYAHLALLDENCNIIAVNESWRRFAQANGYTDPDCGVGRNYLEACESSINCEEALLVAEGIRALLRNERRYFRLVYESSNGSTETWFQLRVNRFYSQGVLRLVVAHEDITEIKRAHDTQQQLTGLLLRTQDEERKRIARDLHDVTVQNVAIIKAHLTRAGKGGRNLETAQEALRESISLCDGVIKELRTLCYLLHPPLLDELGLVAALQWYVRGFIERSGIQVEILLMQEIGRLPTETEMALFYVVQESLTNIHRHSGSRSAIIWVKKDESEVVLRIQDEGRGISMQEGQDMVHAPGVGILGMRQRLKQLGGQLEIESDCEGTLVTARVPIFNTSYASHSSSR